MSQILLNHPASSTVVQKHPLLVEQGVAEDGDDAPHRRVYGFVLYLLPPSAAAGVSGDEVDGVVHGEKEPHEGSLLAHNSDSASHFGNKLSEFILCAATLFCLSLSAKVCQIRFAQSLTSVTLKPHDFATTGLKEKVDSCTVAETMLCVKI